MTTILIVLGSIVERVPGLHNFLLDILDHTADGPVWIPRRLDSKFQPTTQRKPKQ